MSSFNSFPRGKLRLVLCAAATLIAGMLAQTRGAAADTPEYWMRETFKTERPTMTASLQSFAEEGSSRSARRAHAPRRSRSDNPRIGRVEQPKRQKKIRTASLGQTYIPEDKPQKSAAGGGGIRWVASSGCLNGGLRGVLAQVAARFGSVTVNSTCRNAGHNRRVGGASRSWHLSGNAADFRVHGNWGAASSFMRSLVGGFKHYGGGLFHIDTGPRRSW